MSFVLLDFAFLRMSFTVVMPEVHAEVLLVRVTRLLLWTNRRQTEYLFLPLDFLFDYFSVQNASLRSLHCLVCGLALAHMHTCSPFEAIYNSIPSVLSQI